MIILVFVLISILTTKGLKEHLFEAAERKNSRVQKAFKNYEDLVLKNLIQNRVDKDDFQILFIACKSEMRLEIWGGNSETDKLKKYKHLKFVPDPEFLDRKGNKVTGKFLPHRFAGFVPKPI